jgi:chemotaxis methyl-accepting protein methylase
VSFEANHRESIEMAILHIAHQIARNKLVRSYVGSPFISANRALWARLPGPVAQTAVARRYGQFLRGLTKVRDDEARRQSLWTCFLRNRHELAFIERLALAQPAGEPFRIAVLGCSTGPEAYSVAWAMRHACRARHVEIHASDIDAQAVAAAEVGTYRADAHELSGLSPLERSELLIPIPGERFTVRPELRGLISWHVLDATAPDIVEQVGLRDLVVANRFLCHMLADDARRCLRNLARIVAPGGHLLVSGVDLDVRTEELAEAGLGPVEEVTEAIHRGDPTLLAGWPFEYWGLEPLDKSRSDWRRRYAAAYRRPAGPAADPSPPPHPE